MKDGSRDDLLKWEPIPLHQFPKPIACFIEQVSKGLGCDPAFVALPLLVGLGSAVGLTRSLVLKSTWRELAILWGAVIAPSGTIKSPAMYLALRPVYRRQEANWRDYHASLSEHVAAVRRYERDLARWKSAGGEEEQPVLPIDPVAARTWTDDPTVDSLAPLLRDNPRGMLLARNELSGLIAGFDAFTGAKGRDVARWLEMFEGRPLQSDRRGSGACSVSMAGMWILGTLQPEIARSMFEGSYMYNGLTARFFLVMPPALPKRWNEFEPDEPSVAAVDATFERLYDLEMRKDELGNLVPFDVHLDAEARTLWAEMYNRHNQELDRLDGPLRAHWAKLEALRARIALIIHQVRLASGELSPGKAFELDATSLRCADELVCWFGREARRVYAWFQSSDDDRRDALVLSHLRASGPLTTRNLQRKNQRQFRSAVDVKGSLARLIEAGLVEFVEPSDPDARRETGLYRISQAEGGSA